MVHGNGPNFVTLLRHSWPFQRGCTVFKKIAEIHDDVIKWKHFLHYWGFARGFHGSLLYSPHKGQWCRALRFSLICAWTNGRDAGDRRCHHAYYDVTVMNYWYIYLWVFHDIDGLVQDWSTLSAMEILQFCTKPSIWTYLFFLQAQFLIEEGALPHEVDRVLENFGFPMGPLKVQDLAGEFRVSNYYFFYLNPLRAKFSKGTKTNIYILCHSSILTWHR